MSALHPSPDVNISLDQVHQVAYTADRASDYCAQKLKEFLAYRSGCETHVSMWRLQSTLPSSCMAEAWAAVHDGEIRRSPA